MDELAKPILSWPAIIVGIIALLIVGAVVEYILEKRQKAREVRQYQASRQRLTPSQNTIQRYYNRNQYENKGA